MDHRWCPGPQQSDGGRFGVRNRGWLAARESNRLTAEDARQIAEKMIGFFASCLTGKHRRNVAPSAQEFESVLGHSTEIAEVNNM